MPTLSWVNPCQAILLGGQTLLGESPHGWGSAAFSPRVTAVGSGEAGGASCPWFDSGLPAAWPVL